MPHAGELPDGFSPLPMSVNPPSFRREPGETALESLWQLYAHAQGLDLGNPNTCRPDPATMGALLLVLAKEERRKLAALASAASTLADTAQRMWVTSVALQDAIGQVRARLAELERFPARSDFASTTNVGNPE